MMGDAHTDQPELQPTRYLAWEERQRPLAFKAEGLVKDLPEAPPRNARYIWSPGVLPDITCTGCQSNGCNRCARREVIARAELELDGPNPPGYADRSLQAVLSRLWTALGLPRGRSAGSS